MNWKKAWEAFLWVVIVVLFIVVSYQLVLKILGHSWQFEALLTGAVSLIAAGVLKSGNDVSELKGMFFQFDKRFETFEKRFGHLESDFKAHIKKKAH